MNVRFPPHSCPLGAARKFLKAAMAAIHCSCGKAACQDTTPLRTLAFRDLLHRMEETIPLAVLKLRIRNNIMDYLKLASSPAEQRDYECRVPIAQVPNEMICQWEDCVPDQDFKWYSPPEFSADERAAIERFTGIWETVADETPNPMPSSIESLIGTPVWQRLMDAAREALSVFLVRGRINETTVL
jgi:hypothetical protein